VIVISCEINSQTNLIVNSLMPVTYVQETCTGRRDKMADEHWYEI